MGKKNEPLVHVQAHKSWWSGRVTALCGATEEAGRYQTDTWRLFPLPGKHCPTCDRIKKEGKR